MGRLGPRLMVAGTHSGVGKTTVATGLMAALRRRRMRVASAKVGPDFIDPGYHALATGRHPRNLDPWICGPHAIGPLVGRATEGCDILVVEGVMGLFDGSGDGAVSSTADVARLLETPVVLVVDASAMSSSVAAMVRGFRDHDPRLRLGGVILNRVGGAGHAVMLTEALDRIGVGVLGVIHRDPALVWRDRHLGLVPVAEHPDTVAATLDRLAARIEEGCDLEGLTILAQTAPPIEVGPVPLPTPVGRARIAVAAGAAFTFQYRDNIEALEAAGAEIVPFDPLSDRALPAGIDGLVVGGGFPEVYVERLAENTPLNTSVRLAIAGGLPTWAECGGLLWLAESLDGRTLVGALNTEGRMTDRLTLGYREAKTLADTPLAPAGARLRGHEFHYSNVDPVGDGLVLTSRWGETVAGFSTPGVWASYLHLHLGGDPSVAERFVATCARRDGERP